MKLKKLQSGEPIASFQVHEYIIWLPVSLSLTSFSIAPPAIQLIRKLQTQSFENTIFIEATFVPPDSGQVTKVMKADAVVSNCFNCHHPYPTPFMRGKKTVKSWTLLHHLTVRGSFTSMVKMQRSPRCGEQTGPHRAALRLWCGVYSRPTTKTALLPSVVLIKKTAHVEIKQQQQAVCIFRGACMEDRRARF